MPEVEEAVVMFRVAVNLTLVVMVVVVMVELIQEQEILEVMDKEIRAAVVAVLLMSVQMLRVALEAPVLSSFGMRDRGR
jgi:hypothetical protein